MNDLGDDGYKYLGVLEGDNIKMKEMKELVSREFKGRVKLLLYCKLTAGNVIKRINTWAVAVLRFSG